MRARIQLGQALISTVQLLVLIGVSLVVFAVSAYFSMRVAVFGREVTVPRIVEMDEEQARQELALHDLRLEAVGSRHDDLVAVGQILSQTPRPGATLKRGRKVKVQMSLGPEQFQVPQLIGMPVPRARVLLRQDKLRLGQVAYVHSGVQAENLVAAQDPPSGAGVEFDGRVDLLVSQGDASAAWVMPDLVGRPLDQARRFLEGRGFRLGNIRSEVDRATPPGEVLRQFPLAGYPVRRDDLISLVVSGTKENAR